MMTRFPRLSTLVALAALAVPLPAVLAGPLERTDPQHLAPVPPGGYDLPLSPPVIRFALPPQWVTIRSDEEWRTAGQIDKELSRACAERRFRERVPMRYRAIFKRDVLGVAFGHGLNLYDRDKLADPAKIYMFRNGDSTGCIVLSMGNQDARLLQRLGQQPNAATARPR